jgi:2-haloacid dehalogenase
MSLAAGRVKALVFDIFGTVVDWRGSIVREGAALSAELGITVDWPAFADAWRAGYQPAMQRVRSGEVAWTNLDDLHRITLAGLLERFGLERLSEAQREHLNRVWHRLDPWPDSLAGLTRLKSKFVIATLSNGNVSLLVDMAKRAGLPWDTVLSAELMRHYKPDPEVYVGAARLLGVACDELMMVAAHPSDLSAAQRCGLRAAYVHRPLEHGPGRAGEAEPDLHAAGFDIVAADLIDLARRLEA